MTKTESSTISLKILIRLKTAKKAWRLVKKLSGDLTIQRTSVNVTANQNYALELLKNDKPGRKIKRDEIIRDYMQTI